MQRYTVLAAAVLLLTACENPATPGGHIHAYGVVVRDGTQELIRATGATVIGSLEVVAGQQRGPLTARMLDREGRDLEPRHGFWLRVISAAPAIARWDYTQGEYTGRLVGVAAGTTTLEFCNMHGAVGRGHDDGCQNVPVTVRRAQ
jgi:hypothetical protein